MNLKRRSMLKSVGAGGALAALFVAGLVKPLKAIAAEWNKSAFTAATVKDALEATGAKDAVESKDVLLTVPSIAENGAVVPVTVASNIANTTQVSLYVDSNPFPLAASFDFANGAVPEVGVRLKLSKTSKVRAVVMAGGKAYTTSKDVKVTAGGCGG